MGLGAEIRSRSVMILTDSVPGRGLLRRPPARPFPRNYCVFCPTCLTIAFRCHSVICTRAGLTGTSWAERPGDADLALTYDVWFGDPQSIIHELTFYRAPFPALFGDKPLRSSVSCRHGGKRARDAGCDAAVLRERRGSCISPRFFAFQ